MVAGKDFSKAYLSAEMLVNGWVDLMGWMLGSILAAEKVLQVVDKLVC